MPLHIYGELFYSSPDLAQEKEGKEAHPPAQEDLKANDKSPILP